MRKQARFAARQAELTRLNTHLTAMLAGEGRVVLITGEAGQGKTTLMAEFAHRAQTAYPDLAIAGGTCTAYAGVGDPYLPFREILGLLHSGMEQEWTAGQTTADHIFERLTRLLQDLAAQRPLLLLLDDLQWADSGSLHLLFHLGRHLQNRRILILGAFRPTEAAPNMAPVPDLAAQTNQPPLDLRTIVNEFKRRFGNIVVDLDHFDLAAGRQWVDALLDVEPNRLDEAFRLRLFWRTRGHPLFTVELLREMQISGTLIKAQGGVWEVGKAMQWETLPARVEAVIAQRIERLPADLRDLLAVASVEGETFTLQVIARVQQEEERPLLRQLAALQQQHLIREQGELMAGSQRLTRYQFTHILFQQYLYQQLSHAERRLLHREVAAALEASCAEDPALFTIALAHHHAAAEDGEQAIPYLLQAGDQARALYAHQEAIDHYHRALTFLKAKGDQENAARTLMKLGLTYHTAFDYERSRQAYEEGFALWQHVEATWSPPPLPSSPHARQLFWPDRLPADLDPTMAGRNLLTPLAVQQLTTLRLAWRTPNTLDPSMAGTTLSAPITTQLFSGLVAQSPEMEVIPDVARRWEVLDDGRTYVFYLRDDVFWSDGVPVTAADFEYTFKRTLDPVTKTPISGLLLYGIKGARAFHQGEMTDPDQVGVYARDEYTLVVELESSISYFLYTLCYYVLLPVPRHVVARYGAEWTQLAHFVSNGPFRLESLEPGRLMILTRNTGYHGRFSGNVERVELLLDLDIIPYLDAYRANQLDVVYNWFFTSTDLLPLCREYPAEHEGRPRLGTIAAFFDISRPPFDDRRVRRAFALATDPLTLVDRVSQGSETAASGGLVPPGMPGYTPDLARYDPETAQRLLTEAGFPNGRDFPSITLQTSETRYPYAAFLQAQWRTNLNVAVHLQTIDWKLEAAHNSQPVQPTISIQGWAADHADPDNFLRVWLQFDSPAWRNPAYEALIDQTRHATDQAARMTLYQRAEHILAEDAPVIPLFHIPLHLVRKPWVTRFPTAAVKHPGFWHEVVIDTNLRLVYD